jgi:hypothetical protein
MTTGRDTLSKSETVTIAAIESDGVPTLVEARETIAAFHAMIRRKASTELMPWLDRARQSLVASFANGVTKDEAAIRAAIIAVVERPDRRPDHKAQAGQTPDVRPRKDRSAASQTDR